MEKEFCLFVFLTYFKQKEGNESNTRVYPYGLPPTSPV
jgi:hypothetical protein